MVPPPCPSTGPLVPLDPPTGAATPQKPVKYLLDNNRNDIEEGVDAANTQQDEEEVASSV